MKLSYYIQLGFGKKLLTHTGIEPRSFRDSYVLIDDKKLGAEA